jgi:serine protease Do
MNLDAVLLVLGNKADNGAIVQGSGCCVDASRGLVLTTAHQVKGVNSFRALLHTREEFTLTVLAVNEDLDIALLQSTKPLPKAVDLGDAGTLSNGAPVVTISSPGGVAFSTHKGTVANTRYERAGYPVILTDLPLVQGSSGGPVFDEEGRLIGLISGSITDIFTTVVAPINSAFAMLCANGFVQPRCKSG